MKHNYYKQYFDLGQQQIVNFNLHQIGLPEDDSVHTLKTILKELNFDKLLAKDSYKGRKGYHPIAIYALIAYANMRGIRSVDKIVDFCARDMYFI